MGSKWDDAKPAEKLLALYTLLLGCPRAVSLSELADRLECSKQTVCRLIDQIEASQFGKVQREQRGRQAFYRLARPMRTPGISLNSLGLARLALCREFAQKLLPANTQRLMEKSLAQAAAYQDGEENVPLSGLGAQLNKGYIDYSPFEAILNKLISAITGARVCEIGYRPRRDKEPKTFSFAPRRLLAYHECIYVSGWRVTDRGPVKPLYENPLQLALQRFVSCELTRRSASLLHEPEQSALKLGIMPGNEFEVTIRFRQDAATYAAERQWSQNQKVEEKEDGSILMRLTAGNEAECIAWALGFGDSAEIIAPDWLRHAMRMKIVAMARLYNDNSPHSQHGA